MEYRNAVGDLLGVEAAVVVEPPSDTHIAGFETIGAMRLALASEDQASRYETSAFLAAQVALNRPDKEEWVGCTSDDPTDLSCIDGFIRRFGKRAFRRLVSDDEVAEISALAVQAWQTIGSFDAAIEFAIATILQFPDFLYIVEIGTPV